MKQENIKYSIAIPSIGNYWSFFAVRKDETIVNFIDEIYCEEPSPIKTIKYSNYNNGHIESIELNYILNETK